MRELKRYDLVLVRDGDDEAWVLDIFFNICSDEETPFGCNDGCYAQCIPFRENEELLGTANAPQKERWRPKMQDTYWYLNNCLQPYITNYLDCETDNLLCDIGNCFKSKEEAQETADKIKVLLKKR